MTVSSTVRKAGPFAGDGTTTNFPFAFKVFSTADIRVVQTDALGAETDLVIVTDYTVTLNANQNANPGGTVAMVSAPTADYTITIASAVAALQPMDLTNQGGFYPRVLNDSADRQTILIQQLSEAVDRSVKQAISSPAGTDPTLPAPVAGGIIAWNDTGDGFKNISPNYAAASFLADDLANASDPAKGAALVGFLQAGSGAVARTAQAKMRDVVSVKDFGAVGDGVTSDQAAVAAAVAHCNGTGEDLYWPVGTYLTTANVPDFHAVQHRGAGIVKRGSNLFYVAPYGSQSNAIYVSTTGADTNDGLSAAQPIRTVQGAVNAVTKQPIRTQYTISCEAGTYNEAVTLPDYQLQADAFFTIKGPDTATVQTTPTMVLDGTAKAANAAINGGRGNKFKLQNILYTNWTGGIDCTLTGTGSYSWLVNQQSTDATARSLGIIDRGGVALVQGGKKDGGQIGFDCYSGSTLTIGYNATSTANSTIIRNTTLAGVYCKSHVHVVSNYGLYEDNALAVLGYHNSRFDTKGDDFRRNTRVFRMQGSYVSENISPASTYNYGTADANTIVWELDQFSAMDLYHAGGRGGLDVAHQRQSTTLTGTISATMARALKTIAAYSLTTAGRYVEVECVVAGSGAAGTKTVQLKLGSTVIGTYTIASGTVIGKFRAVVWASNTTSVVVVSEVDGLTLVSAMRSAPSVDMTVDQSLEVWLTIPGAADTATLHEARCVLWG